MSQLYSSDATNLVIEHFPFIESSMIPIALKGYPVSTILRIITIFSIALVIISPDGFDYMMQRNILILALITILFTSLLKETSFDSTFYNMSLVIFIIYLVSSIFNSTEYTSLFISNFLALIWIFISFFFIKDRHFYAKLLYYSYSPNQIENLYYTVKSLNFGIKFFNDEETANLLGSIARFYKELGIPHLEEKAKLLQKSKLDYLENAKYIYGYPAPGLGFPPYHFKEFDDFDKFKRHVEYEKK